MTAAELVQMQFPGKLYISMVVAGSALGIAEQSCYNLKSCGRFPVPIHKFGSKNMVALTDLVKYMDDLMGYVQENKVSDQEIKRRPGRPTKKEQIERSRRLS